MAHADRPGPQVDTHLALVLRSSNEPGELLLWQCHYDSTVNIVMAVVIISFLAFFRIAVCSECIAIATVLL